MESYRHRCDATGKHRFRDHREAVDALHAASNGRAFASELGQRSTRQEVRSYRCKECSGWHLTSQQKWLGADGRAADPVNR